jgi:hypothetical protein
MRKKIGEWWADYWQSLMLLFTGVLAFSSLYLFRLGALIPGDSMFEEPKFLGISEWHQLIDNTAFAPLKLFQAAMVRIDDPNATLLRLLSAGSVLIAVLALYFILERWHTRRLALMGAALFASSSYSLHQGRFAGHEVLYLLVIPIIIMLGLWLRSKYHVSKLPLALSIGGLLLYVPGVWLMIVPLVLLFRKQLHLAWKVVNKKRKIIGLASLLIVISPLIYGSIRFPSNLTSYLGIDRLTTLGFTDALKQLIIIPKQLLISGPDEPIKWLIGTPILDVATAAFVILGTYSYARGRHPLRARLLGFCIIVGIIVIASSIYATVALLLPAIYILATNGIAYLLQSWFTVFPRNPAARSAGVILLLVVLIFISTYHVKRYFIAWPNSSHTKQALRSSLN